MTQPSITKVLVANRGEISCRVQQACKKLGLDAVAVFTSPDALSKHVLGARESVCLGDSPKEYLNGDKLIEVALATGKEVDENAL
jgi:acetyl/propionyl-CoA carboxylase alpha subunit